MINLKYLIMQVFDLDLEVAKLLIFIANQTKIHLSQDGSFSF